MIRSLLWKEWYEQRWKLAFGSVILMSYVAIGLQTRAVPDLSILVGSMLIGSFLLPVFSAMGLLAPERNEGSLGSLLALPVHPWWILVVKTGVGASVCVLPVLGAAIVACLMAGGREVSASEIFVIAIGTVCMGLTLLVWTLSCGIRQRTEAQVGLVGFLVVVALLLTFGIFSAETWPAHNTWWACLHPLSFLEALDLEAGRGSRIARVALVQTVIMIAVWCSGATRLSKR